MFERYTEGARKAVFFARFEASEAGSPYIETEHLLLGLLREDEGLRERVRGMEGGIFGVRERIEKAAPARANAPGSVDLPLSPAGAGKRGRGGGCAGGSPD